MSGCRDQLSRSLIIAGFQWLICLGLCHAVVAQTRARWKIHDMRRPRPLVVSPAKQQLPVPPPKDAIVLFGALGLNEWQDEDGNPAGWQVRKDWMEPVRDAGSIITKLPFGDVQLHVEWASPLPAKGTGQHRGNSGVFFMGLYEVQILDSYESDTYPDGQAAAVYGQYPPLANVCLPPGEWQAFDIVFRRPRFRADGELETPARITVIHNGVLVQDNVELKGPTKWLQYRPYRPHADKLPLLLQDHGDPVRYRNIWVRPLAEHQRPPDVEPAELIEYLPPNVLDRYTGKYEDEEDAGIFFTVTRSGDRLRFRIFKTEWIDLVPRHSSEFALRWADGRMVFNLDKTGRPVGLVFHVGGKARSAKRVE